jgi:hypothetical protein
MRTSGTSLKLIALLAAFVLAAVGAATAGANNGTFADPAGDAGNGPDVTGIALSDSPTGLLQFAVTTPGMAVGTPTNMFVLLDTDRNATTGFNGAEYILYLTHDSTGGVYGLDQWQNNDLVQLQAPSLTFTVSGDTFTFSLSKTEIGTPQSFNLSVLAAAMDAAGNVASVDRAPDSGAWIYELTATPPAVVKPVIGMPVLTPAKPKAGKTLTVSFPVKRSDTGAGLATGTMICDPSVSGKVITHRESFANGTARLAFTVPKTAKGKVLKVQVTIKLGNQSDHRVVTYKVS